MIGFVCFMLLVLFFAGLAMFGSPPEPIRRKTSDWDMIDIATIRPTRSVERHVTHPLENDCVATLVRLGEKKTVAAKQARQILNSNNIGSVEDFVRAAYSKK